MTSSVFEHELQRELEAHKAALGPHAATFFAMHRQDPWMVEFGRQRLHRRGWRLIAANFERVLASGWPSKGLNV